ncbi:MAG TPA: PilZ domain-containing protein [Mycobacteriales bacterium]|nr:PilZ domain-containing protein [Mycobacteriales bacterium]
MTAADLPPPGSAVRLTVPDGGRLAAVVDAVETAAPPAAVLLREPWSVDDLRSPDLAPGTALLLEWTSARGLHAAACAVERRRHDVVELWRLVLEGPPGVQQRRAFVRVQEALPAQVHADGVVADAVVVDLSEGGARCVLRVDDRLQPHAVVALHLELDGDRLQVEGDLLEVAPHPEGTTVRLRLRPGARLAARLRRHVVGQQRRALAVRR